MIQLYKPLPDDSTQVAVPHGSMKRYVVCAANQDEDRQVFLGVRHHCPLMNSHLRDIGVKAARTIQGFVDQYGTFMDREEAWKVATAALQIRRLLGYDYERDSTLTGELYSEHLY